MIEDNEWYILLRISDVYCLYCVEHSRTFENGRKITLGQISGHMIIAFRCV